MIFQSSLASPTGGTARRAACTLPSELTYRPGFSVKAAPGKTTSARLAPRSPWWPWYTTKAPSGTSSSLQSSAPRRYTNLALSLPFFSTSSERKEGTKPTSSAPTRAAASCKMLYPFHSWDTTVLAASTKAWISFKSTSLSALWSTPGPTMTMGFLACLKVCAKAEEAFFEEDTRSLSEASESPRCAVAKVKSTSSPTMPTCTPS
mmetsp:Transcript_10509/g.21640  ORF Transcript_10509/g.21640 Transcript_10509/m.21640 type:complete len:205 (+) Transcript_10509:382-996(+)